LTLVDSGVNAYVGVAAWLEAHKQNEFQFRPAQDRASLGRLGQLTAAITLQLLVPVLIILLAFTKFAGEREDGMLPQLLASGVAPRLLVAGKGIGVAAALGLVLVPAALLGTAALLWTSGPDAMSQSVVRLGALMSVYALYFAVFIAVGLGVSAYMSKASHALAVLVAFWAFNAVVAPRAASDASRLLHPAPTALEFANAVEQETYDGLAIHVYNVRRAADLRRRLFDRYRVTRVEDLPVNFRGVDYLEREAHANDIWERHYRQLWTTFESQSTVHQLAGFAAPLLAVRAVSMALTGTDFHHHRQFAQAAETYRRQMVLAMNTNLAYGGSYAAHASLWATVPPFEYRQPDLRWSLSQVRTSALALIAWVLCTALALVAAARRLGVE
jgi:ABC-2 type transport system permease protein